MDLLVIIGVLILTLGVAVATARGLLVFVFFLMVQRRMPLLHRRPLTFISPRVRRQ